MVVLVEVRIGNILDDIIRSGIFAYNSNDTNIENNLSVVIGESVELDDYSKEYIIDYKKIKPPRKHFLKKWIIFLLWKL